LVNNTLTNAVVRGGGGSEVYNLTQYDVSLIFPPLFSSSYD